MTERNSFQIAAAEMATSFETASRPDGGDFIRCKDGAPGWVRDAVREAHGDRVPDDCIYSLCFAAADRIEEYDSEREAEDGSEFADGQVDVYDSDRTKWFAAHAGNAEYVDEARRDFGPSEQGVMGDIGQGQYRQAAEIYGVILRVVVERSEELYPDAV